MDKTLTAVEVIGLAIRSEEEASRFYGRLAKRIRNGLVRAKYEALAREEVGHRRLLTGLYEQMTGEAAPPRIPGAPEVAEGGDEADPEGDIERLVLLAIEREHRAAKFYADAALAAADHSGRSLLEYLADIERGHAAMLEGELRACRRDANWYADNPDLQLVGP